MPRLAPTPPRIEPVLTGRQLAAVHGVTLKTIRRWAEAGEFDRYRRTPGGAIEVPVEAYHAFCQRHEFTRPEGRKGL